MKTLFATFSYLLIAVSVMQNWWLLALGLVVIFSMRFGSFALIPLAILIDGYFGSFYSVPVLSLSAVGWYVMVEFLRPRFVNLSSS